MEKITPLILCGGGGTRLWPVSRHERPKPFLRLGGRSLLARTLARLDHECFGSAIIIADEKNRFLVAEALKEAGIEQHETILEPEKRNTAAAISVGALASADKADDGLILVMPSDHIITDMPAFYQAIDRAAPAARCGHIVAFGIQPSSPEEGYGYIEQGAGVENMDGAWEIKNFIEKPNAALAQKYIETGGFLWNAGIFLFRANIILDAFRAFAPDILDTARRAFDERVMDSGFFRLGGMFAAAREEAFDTAIMEKAARHADIKSAVVPVDMGWRDIGSWRSFWEIADKDQEGNAIIGEGKSLDSQNCLIYSADGRAVFALGVDHLAIISTDDAVLVMDKNHAGRVGEVRKLSLKMKREI